MKTATKPVSCQRRAPAGRPTRAHCDAALVSMGWAVQRGKLMPPPIHALVAGCQPAAWMGRAFPPCGPSEPRGGRRCNSASRDSWALSSAASHGACCQAAHHPYHAPPPAVHGSLRTHPPGHRHGAGHNFHCTGHHPAQRTTRPTTRTPSLPPPPCPTVVTTVGPPPTPLHTRTHTSSPMGNAGDLLPRCLSPCSPCLLAAPPLSPHTHAWGVTPTKVHSLNHGHARPHHARPLELETPRGVFFVTSLGPRGAPHPTPRTKNG